jgi:hypothetical protein
VKNLIQKSKYKRSNQDQIPNSNLLILVLGGFNELENGNPAPKASEENRVSQPDF